MGFLCFSGDFLVIFGLTKVPFGDYFFLRLLKQIQVF